MLDVHVCGGVDARIHLCHWVAGDYRAVGQEEEVGAVGFPAKEAVVEAGDTGVRGELRGGGGGGGEVVRVGALL